MLVGIPKYRVLSFSQSLVRYTRKGLSKFEFGVLRNGAKHVLNVFKLGKTEKGRV
jgi:hypothetical protein